MGTDEARTPTELLDEDVATPIEADDIACPRDVVERVAGLRDPSLASEDRHDGATAVVAEALRLPIDDSRHG